MNFGRRLTCNFCRTPRPDNPNNPNNPNNPSLDNSTLSPIKNNPNNPNNLNNPGISVSSATTVSLNNLRTSDPEVFKLYVNGFPVDTTKEEVCIYIYLCIYNYGYYGY